ncbi:MAG: LysM peptidoglycan-binding domain-containing protein [Clostridium sp.]|nr:LysM peptidoglycan-binding domain-containing protein [Clostridium sp.]
MVFKDFVFPSNPTVLEVKASTNIHNFPIANNSSRVENVSVNPSIVEGSGVFFGDRGEEYCLYLQHLLRLRTAGVLLLPTAVGMNAYLTRFSYKKSSNKNEISYSFTFTEDCSSKKEERLFYFTVAENGENAFDIANRCNVSVDDIMRLNTIATPFSIKAGDKVVLYDY